MKHLLVVDDELGARESLRAIFSKAYRVDTAATADEATRMLCATRVDLVLLDVMMPEKDGLSLLKDIAGRYPDVPVVMVSASTSIEPVVRAIKSGARDYVTKPFDVDAIRRVVARTLENSALQRRVQVLEREVSHAYPIDNVIGQSPGFKQAMADARKAAESDATVLITGESGTGKELVARSVHAWSTRHGDPFVAVNCAALPDGLMESELFGHEKGAFTGADHQKPGRFDLAGSGTLFLDEITEMTPPAQAKLLRVLQEKEFVRVGGARVIRTNARIVAATGKDLRKEVSERRFRDDLYYRLSVVPIRLPPLRERPGDIAILAQHFFEHYRRQLDAETKGMAPATLALLCGYAWPGNVRELRNIVERMLVLHRHAPLIQPEHLPEEFFAGTANGPDGNGNGQSLADAVGNYERRLILQALRDTGGVQTAAARQLGTTRRILKYRMEQLKIRSADVTGDGT